MLYNVVLKNVYYTITKTSPNLCNQSNIFKITYHHTAHPFALFQRGLRISRFFKRKLPGLAVHKAFCDWAILKL